MATLNTPILEKVSCFDPNYAHTFNYTYTGVQIVKTRLIIVNRITLSTIYNVTQDGTRLNYNLPGSTLTTNTSYTAQVQVYDENGNSSNLSEAILFYCYLTPTFNFSNISTNDVISSANYTANLSFTQSEGDNLQEFAFYLYDTTKTQLLVSDTLYSASAKSYIYYGLENLSTYYFRAIGKSAYGFLVDTGYILASVKYTKIPSNLSFVGENIDGKIILTSNIVTMDYILTNNNYTLQDGLFTLTNNSISYDISNSEVDGDFALVVKAKLLPVNEQFAELKGNKFNVFLSIVNINNVYYGKLTINNTLSHYIIYVNILSGIIGTTDSNPIVDINGDMFRVITDQYNTGAIISFQVNRHNGIYNLIVSYT